MIFSADDFIFLFDSAELSNRHPILLADLPLRLRLAAPHATCSHPQRKSQFWKCTKGKSCHILMRPTVQITSSSLDWCQIIITRPACMFLIQHLGNQSYYYDKWNRPLGPWKHNLKLFWKRKVMGFSWFFIFMIQNNSTKRQFFSKEPHFQAKFKLPHLLLSM